jgi:hypothetical protein
MNDSFTPPDVMNDSFMTFDEPVLALVLGARRHGFPVRS